MEAIHLYGPWILLYCGVLGLIQTVFFYQKLIDFTIRLCESPQLHELFRHDQRMKTMLNVFVSLLKKPFYYWFNMIWALLSIIASTAWFAFRPT